MASHSMSLEEWGYLLMELLQSIIARLEAASNLTINPVCPALPDLTGSDSLMRANFPQISAAGPPGGRGGGHVAGEENHQRGITCTAPRQERCELRETCPGPP